MVSRLSVRDTAAGVLSAWLIVACALALLAGQSSFWVVALLVFVAMALVAGLVLVARDVRQGEPPDLVLTLSAPAVGAVFVGLVVAQAGNALLGLLLTAAPAVAVIVLMALEHPASLRETLGRFRGMVRPPAPEPPAPVTEAAPKAPKLTPAERLAQFTSEAFAYDSAQLETLVTGWTAVDKQSRENAWYQVKPVLTASDRMALFTGVRDRLGRWASGSGDGEDAGRDDVPSQLRRQAFKPLLDAAAAVIVQDRVNKRPFEVLYAPFRMVQSGEPPKIRIAPGVLAPASPTTTTRRKTPATAAAAKPSGARASTKPAHARPVAIAGTEQPAARTRTVGRGAAPVETVPPPEEPAGASRAAPRHASGDAATH